jgi:quercetin dioxygenase-like cupin family protein
LPALAYAHAAFSGFDTLLTTLGREREEARSMARSGEEIHNPIQGDSILFRHTARDTGGELMSGELVVSPGGGNPLHVHPLQEEHFEVLSGTLGVQIGDEHRSLGQGQEATVPPGTPHRWFNDSAREEARVLGEVRPALNSEVFFETLYGLARDGRTDESGVPNLLQFAVMLNGLHKGEIYLAEPPIALQKALFALLSPAGKLLGYRDHYPRYSAPDTLSGEGAGPPSTTSVMARAVAIAASLVIASLLLVGRTRRSEG